MNKDEQRLPILFRDDGHPEARDYDSNYLVLTPKPARGLLQRLLEFGGARRQRGAEPPRADRIEPPAPASA